MTRSVKLIRCVNTDQYEINGARNGILYAIVPQMGTIEIDDNSSIMLSSLTIPQLTLAKSITVDTGIYSVNIPNVTMYYYIDGTDSAPRIITLNQGNYSESGFIAEIDRALNTYDIPGALTPSVYEDISDWTVAINGSGKMTLTTNHYAMMNVTDLNFDTEFKFYNREVFDI